MDENSDLEIETVERKKKMKRKRKKKSKPGEQKPKKPAITEINAPSKQRKKKRKKSKEEEIKKSPEIDEDDSDDIIKKFPDMFVPEGMEEEYMKEMTKLRTSPEYISFMSQFKDPLYDSSDEETLSDKYETLSFKKEN